MKEKWRFRCPNGHCGWQKRLENQVNNKPKSKFYCGTCKDQGLDPHFNELVDMKEPDRGKVVDINVEAV